ncbi:hypothetical protein B0I37DRAFT_376645 [Chaetomium sp. MPI-CAGE-AT-0009]|nr:hypothetical protein B0I37DRAFT_376645 [Chaetomium sp. MPI-CAGE-AT-0009]
MKFTTCARVLSAAVIASAASVPTHGEQAHNYGGTSHGEKIKHISWEEAVKIMGGGVKVGGGGFNGKTSSKIASASNNTATELASSSSCTPNVRPEWNSMTNDQKGEYVKSVRCLMDTPPLGVWDGARNIWDEITWVHREQSGRIHSSDSFLPWHRYYLHMLKTLLAERCDYTGPMPWWQETAYTGRFATSGIFEPEYFGALPPLTSPEGTCITDGAFNHTTILTGPDGPTCLARGEDRQTTDQATTAFLDLCHGNASTEYTRHRLCVEQTIHGIVHVGLGPTMWLLATSPGDPVFFLHHGFVDWQWKRWQTVNSARSASISGCAEFARDGSCIPLTRDTVLTTMGLIPDMTVGDVLDTENDVMCYTYDRF